MGNKEAPVLEMKVFQGPDGETARMERPVERVRLGIGDRWQRFQDRLQEVGSMGPEAYAEKLRTEREAKVVARGERVGDALTNGLGAVRDSIQGHIDSGTVQRFVPTQKMSDKVEQMKKKYWEGKVLDLKAQEITTESHGAGR